MSDSQKCGNRKVWKKKLLILEATSGSQVRECKVGPKKTSSVSVMEKVEERDRPVDAGTFYGEYHGHTVPELQRVHALLRNEGTRCIFLAGDSSLDNKHWFFQGGNKRKQLHDPSFTAGALNGYERVLQPARMVMDVSYWMNCIAQERLGSAHLCTINASI